MSLKPVQKTGMPQEPPLERRRTFDEVNLGYTDARARFEATRCLQCQEPLCEDGCPVRVPIKAFLKCVADGRFQEAFDRVRAAHPLPAICGRVCPQESQCEKLCHMAPPPAPAGGAGAIGGRPGGPVGIGHLERFVADWARAHRVPVTLSSSKGDLRRASTGSARTEESRQGPRVAIVGSGPAGLTAAGELARRGCRVTIFEALHEPGGVLRYGIPEFRLPKEVLDDEISQLKVAGVEIVCDVVIGKTLTLDQLMGEMGFQVVFIGTGAGLPRFLGIPGENLNGVTSANEFLTRLNLMKAYRFPEWHTPLKVGQRVAVVGAGNTAMDAARSAMRMGAQEVQIVYRRSEREMTARQEEYGHAQEEGVIFRWLTNPVRAIGSEEGWITGLECRRMRLGEPDDSGRARPVAADEPPFVVPIDTLVVAIGTRPNRLLTGSGALAATSWGGLVVQEETGETSRPAVYAGGDAVTGAATVILAAGAGLRAAAAIHERLLAAKTPAALKSPGA